MKHIKKTLNAWDRFWDRLYNSPKARDTWNEYICPAIEVAFYGLVTLIMVFALYVGTYSLILIFC